ncbi:MAG: oxidoreductase, partial [Armatimonadota bacterium]
MADHERFRCRSLDDLRARVAELGLDIHFEEQIEALRQPVRIGHISSPNALAVHPMEGCDGKPDGSPSELTYRRYDRFARGGAGLIWFEATAVLREARANPRQLWIHPGNVDEFARLVSHMRKAACEEFGPRFRQVIICQLTHSGRYSRPEGSPSPVIAHHCPYLDPSTHVLPDLPVVSDDRLEQIQDAFAAAARLAHQAGFDGVDIKSCHRYLISELLASHTRQGRYGGPFETRTRFLRSVAARLHAELGASFIVACRLN